MNKSGGESQSMDINFRNPCNECPFRRESLPGWLGPWTPLDLLRSLSVEPFPCHQTIPQGYQGDYNDDRLKGCAGAAIFLNNTLEMSRCRVTSEHQRQVRDVDDSVTLSVFASKQEFIDHHDRDNLKANVDRRLSRAAVPEPEKPPTPTLDRIAEIQDETRAIGEFLEWMSEKGYMVAVYQYHQPLVFDFAKGEYVETNFGPDCYGRDDDCPHIGERGHKPMLTAHHQFTIRNLLYQYFEVDEQEENRERAALMKYLGQVRQADGVAA